MPTAPLCLGARLSWLLANRTTSYPGRMLACHDCHRFVREQSTSCPFCGAALAAARAPIGGFLGVLLGVSLVACAGDDDGSSASGTVTVADDSSTSDDDATIGNDSSSATEVSGPLYGPVTFDDSGGTSGGSESSDGSTDGESDSSETGTGTSSDSGTDSGDTTIGGDESAGPLYGPATSN
jgi:hypothetical protein